MVWSNVARGGYRSSVRVVFVSWSLDAWVVSHTADGVTVTNTHIPDADRPTCPVCKRPANRHGHDRDGNVQYICGSCHASGTSVTFEHNAIERAGREPERTRPAFWEVDVVREVAPAVQSRTGCRNCQDTAECAENQKHGGGALCETFVIGTVGLERREVML